MPIRFQILPKNAVQKISKYLDNKSLLRLRETCKPVKEEVDASILKNRKTLIEICCFYNYMNPACDTDWPVLYMAFNCKEAYLMWKYCVTWVLRNIEMADKYDMPSNDDADNSLAVSLPLESMLKFIEFLKCFVGRASFQSILIGDVEPELFQRCKNFFQGYRVEQMNIFQKKFGCNSFGEQLDLINKLQPIEVFCELQSLTRESSEFLERLGETVQIVRLTMEEKCDSITAFIPVIRNGFHRKCKILILMDNTPCITQEFAEKLIEFFHHSETNVSLVAQTNQNPSECVIGVFKMVCDGNDQHGERIISIMDELAWSIARTVYPFLALTALTGVCLNTALLLTTIRTKTLRSTANILIGCCALFDVVHQTGYFVFFPILFSDYYIDSWYCSCMQFLPELGMGAGAFCVLCIGIDRMLSAVRPMDYKRLSMQILKYQFLAIALFCCWTAYLMIAYWTPKKLICGMPSPFHGSALALWSRSLHLVNLASAVLYFITWQTLLRRSMSANAKKIFVSMAVVMTFEVTAWFISTALINLSQVIAVPEHRPPFHYVACLFVNIGIAFKTVIYYLISSEYRNAIRAFFGLKSKTALLVSSNSNVSTEIITTI